MNVVMLGDTSANTFAGGEEMVTKAAALLALFQRYVVEYTTLQHPITPDLMVEDYTLRSGDYRLRGRDTEYKELVKLFFTQYPKMGMTVHDLVTNGDRIAFRYTEHGRDALNDGVACAWTGIGLYKWDGSRFTEHFGEQDAVTRAMQTEGKLEARVEPPLVSPWETEPMAENPDTVQAVRSWLDSDALTTTKHVFVDNEWMGASVPRILRQNTWEEIDLFSAGGAAAFHIVQRGTLLADFAPRSDQTGASVDLSVAGIVRVDQGKVISGNIIRNKMGLMAKLA